MTDLRRYAVTISRTVPIDSVNPFDAGLRALDLMQRQKAWPGSLTIQVVETDEPGQDKDDDG